MLTCSVWYVYLHIRNVKCNTRKEINAHPKTALSLDMCMKGHHDIPYSLPEKLKFYFLDYWG